MLEHDVDEDLKSYSDAALVSLYRSGEQKAFQQLAVRYFLSLKKRVAAFVCNEAESDDLFQESLLGLHDAVCSYDENGGASFRTYSDICIRNRLVSYIRRLRSAKNAPQSRRATIEEADSLPSSPESNPENAMIDVEELHSLEQYIRNNLSSAEATVLELYISGRTYDEISAALNISKKSCDNAMQRIRRKLRAWRSDKKGK